MFKPNKRYSYDNAMAIENQSMKLVGGRRRLPTIFELMKMDIHGREKWSSTPHAFNPSFVWFINKDGTPDFKHIHDHKLGILTVAIGEDFPYGNGAEYSDIMQWSKENTLPSWHRKLRY